MRLLTLATTLVAAGGIVALVLGVLTNREGEESDFVVATPDAVPALATPTPPGAEAPVSAPVRIVIARIGVDAPVTVKGIDAEGVMEPPDGPEDVAWYGFTAQPGKGSNAVFSAHVDYRDYGLAVFARLDDLRKGDLVEVRLADGSLFRYEVVLSRVYETVAAPAQDIVGPTSREVITLITCAGRFDEVSRQYSHRLMVRAERV
jgi:LPXTG-site transpeptidase (sortase) family protein